ncbi:MAG: formate dehydrogenase accessory sulfurtransferase FdhD [Planctomycetes bacterium]|nr:formate dehydrogenase accessory sulfurtransferase FdhD [Planctomycetota bacterium]
MPPLPPRSARKVALHEVRVAAAAAAAVPAVAPAVARRRDLVAVEEPLEIRLDLSGVNGPAAQSLCVTMRTPGEDFALAAGFLFAEGLVRGRDDLGRMTFCVGPDTSQQEYNRLTVELRRVPEVPPENLIRHFFATSACGVCGKAALDGLRLRRLPAPPPGSPRVSARALCGAPALLRAGQDLFARTGGLHAAALFDPAGAIVALAEDVGRHNAVDKVVGTQVLAGCTSLSDRLLVVSGRSSFEILQKALVAGIPLVAAVGAPSSLAVDLAREFGVTLVGFLRPDRFNIYAGADRIDS